MKFLRFGFMEAVLAIGAMVVQVAGVRTDYDPLQSDNFCRRHSHATAQINDRLYIDGGYINTKASDLTNYTMDHLLFLDLNNDITKLPALAGPLSKPPAVPRVVGGQLWADEANGRLFMFGGEFPEDEKTLDVPHGVWTYDTWNDTWSLLPSSMDHEYTRPSFGAGTVLEHEGRAYYLGGWVGKQNVPGWTGPRMALPGMVIYNMVDNTWRNETTGPERPFPRVEGVLLFVSAGDRGLLVSFGGVYAHPNGTVEPAPMSEIDIYDLAGGFWYTQKATGDVPETRRLFCAGVGAAVDGSSHNVYLYGGAATKNNNIGYGDVYILTMPSFRWIKWYPDSDKVRTNPHNSLTCNVVKSHQMIIMGGHFPNQTTCDVPVGFGVHNLDMSAYNEPKTMWYGYSKKDNGYLVPQAVVDVVGGGPNGTAVVQTPESGGFTDPALKTLFTRKFTASPREPTRIPPAKVEENKKRLISIIVPAVAGVLLLAILIGFFIIHRRRKQRKQLLANPIGGGGNPAYPYMNEVGGPMVNGPVDHITAFQLPTTQSPATRNFQLPPLRSANPPTPGRSPFYQPGDDATPYGQYRGNSFMELASPEGPTHLATLQPQELPTEYYTPTEVGKKGMMMDGIVMSSTELSGDTEALGLAVARKLSVENARKSYFRPISGLEVQEEQWGGYANISIPERASESFIRRSVGPIVPLSAPPPPRKMNSIKPLPRLPAEVTAQSTLNGALGAEAGRKVSEGNSSEHQAHQVLPTTPSRKSSRKSARQTQEEREMLASGPYYPPSPNNDNDSLMSMPTPTCETAGFALMVSPVAVVATHRVSVFRVHRSGTEKGGRPRRPPVPVVPLEEGPGIRYDSEGVRMV